MTRDGTQSGSHSQRLYSRRYENCLRPEPLEWVYEGLTPALPTALLVNGGRAGDLSIAIIYASVAARLGVRAAPVTVGDTGQAQLPAEIAGRYAGLAAAPPPGDAWLLRLTRELRYQCVAEICCLSL